MPRDFESGPTRFIKGEEGLVSDVSSGHMVCSDRWQLVVGNVEGTKVYFQGIHVSLLWCISFSVTGQ